MVCFVLTGFPFSFVLHWAGEETFSFQGESLSSWCEDLSVTELSCSCRDAVGLRQGFHMKFKKLFAEETVAEYVFCVPSAALSC